MARHRPRLVMLGVVAALVSAVIAAPAYAKTARNYCCDWNAYGASSVVGAATAAKPYQVAKGYTVYNYQNVNSSNVYSALQVESLVLAGSHANKGNMIFNNAGSCTCITSNFSYGSGHTHTIANWVTGAKTTFTCKGSYQIRSMPTSYGYGASPCRLVMWMGCYTYGDPDGSGSKQSLTWAGYYEGITHNAGFVDEVYLDSWATDFSAGYWKSLAAGSYTNAAMDAGVSYVKSRHLNIAGGYDLHDYDGGNIKI